MLSIIRTRTLGVALTTIVLALAVAAPASAQGGGLPSATIGQLASQLSGLVDSAGNLTATPEQVQAIVSSLGLPAGETAQVAEILQSFADAGAVGNADQIANLISQLIAAPPLDGGLIDQLNGVLPPGETPTGAQLKPLADAFRSLSQTQPEPLKGVLLTLAGQIDTAGGNPLDANVLDQLQAVLAGLGAAPADLLDLNKLIGSLVPRPAAAPTPQASPPPPAQQVAPTPVVAPAITQYRLTLKVRKIVVAKNKKTAKVMLRSTAPQALAGAFVVQLGRKTAVKATKVTLPAGRDVTKKVKLTRATTKALKKKGGNLKATPAYTVPGLETYPGVTIAASAKTLKVKKPKKRRARR